MHRHFANALAALAFLYVLLVPAGCAKDETESQQVYLQYQVDEPGGRVRGVYVGLVGVTKENGRHSFLFSNVGRSTGKWYFETQFFPSRGRNDPSSSEGVCLIATALFQQGHSAFPPLFRMPSNVLKRLRFGVLVGVAMDLDGKRLYYAMDGQWVNGDPANGLGGFSLELRPLFFPPSGKPESKMSRDQIDRIEERLKEKQFYFPYVVANQVRDCPDSSEVWLMT